MNKLFRALSTFAGLALLTTAAHAANVTMKGSDTMVILAQKWAEVYMQKNPETKVQVTGGGSGTGFAALQNQQTDLANASRKIKAKEVEACLKAFGKRPTEYKVALDGLSVYVHESNPIKLLSVEQIRNVFTGKIRNWKEVGGPDQPITLYSRENSSGTYEFFKENVLQGQDFAASAQAMPGTAALLQAVARDPKAIGYGGAAYGQGAKHISVSKETGGQGIEPTEENILNQSYPIWRYLFIYVNPALDTGDVKKYLTWIRGDEGQALVKDVGYFPLPPKLRSGQIATN
ncbi:MAG TPA: phosphate ABC transporter substrate-binding protein [Candidatus Kapabacteria bacterium]|nr:phosphate ABC transporter substrate-binding protein [Candidatus Kapabacteria bacterium]